MEYGRIDLHMHTVISDGTDTLEEILEKVGRAGIGLFSITDHDAVKSADIMPGLLKGNGPSFITGVEFSCRDEKGQYHILGYGYDPKGVSIRSVVEYGHSLRMKKTAERIEFLRNEFGFRFPQDRVDAILALDNPGKPHIGNLMVELGYAESRKEAIEEFIDRKHFRDEYVRPEDAIRGILESGGIPVLAHPFYGSGDQLILGREMEERLDRLVGFGLKGLECCYSGFTDRLRTQALELAGSRGLYVTAGSDYHGKNKIVELGDTGMDEERPCPDALLSFLKDVKIYAGLAL